MLKDILSTLSATLFTLSHRVPSSSASPYQLKQLELVTLFTNSAVFRRCRWGINLIILQFALAPLFLAERETLAAVLLGCLSLWSASQCERTDSTCPDRCTDSSGFLCENAFTSPFPSLSLSVPIFCSGLHFLVVVHLLACTHSVLFSTHTDNIIPFWLSQVQLFEKMVEREDGVMLYSQYMEVNSISQSVRDRYLRLTNGIFLNEVMRVM